MLKYGLSMLIKDRNITKDDVVNVRWRKDFERKAAEFGYSLSAIEKLHDFQ